MEQEKADKSGHNPVVRHKSLVFPIKHPPLITMATLHRLSRSRSHSPESSFSDGCDILGDPSGSSASIHNSGRSNTCDLNESINLNQKKTRRLRLSFRFETKLDPKSKICFLMTALLVFCSTLQTGAKVLLNKNTPANLRRASNGECPIQRWHYPDCSKHSNILAAPQATDEKWLEFRRKYQAVVGEEASTLDPTWSEFFETDSTDARTATLRNGFHVPVEVRTAPGKGRGIFLKTSVTKGQKLWDNRYTARFPDECSVRMFFASISEEDSCRVIIWGYVNDFAGEGQQFLLDLDDAVYLNEGQSTADVNTHSRFLTPAENNGIKENTQKDTVASMSNTNTAQRILEPVQQEDAILVQRRFPGNFGVFASQDMESGTELLGDYSEIHAYKSLFWYEKMCYRSIGLLGYLLWL